MAGVYLAYPFCSQKCTYCNFASGVLPAELEPQYIEALCREIRDFQWAWKPETVYLGGGTPSRIAPEALARLLEIIPGSLWAEATMEAAPGGITRELAEAWRRAGITRVSLGVQSFVETELRLTGRRHTAEVVREEVAVLRSAGISEINIDLIAGLAAQTPDSWRESLEWLARLEPPHVSVYMLEVDEDSRLGLEILNGGGRYGAARTPPDDQIAEMYEAAVEHLALLGIARYEISNFARPGHESRHNLKYWRGEQYAGFGADAHGFDGHWRVSNTDDVTAYVRLIAAGKTARVQCVESHPEEERFFVGLRLMQGIHAGPEEWERHGAAIGRFLDAGLLERCGDILRLTGRGVLLSNEVFQEFLTAR